ncbi:unnamed protein product [Rhodiola kirilowii]
MVVALLASPVCCCIGRESKNQLILVDMVCKTACGYKGP